MDPTLPKPEDLDPASAGDVDTIRRLLEEGTLEQVADDAFLAAVSAESPCPRLRGEAQLMRGMVIGASGDRASAKRHYTEGLRTTWGSGGSIERRAVINLSIICINEQRPLEAMLLARRAREIGDDFLDTFLSAIAELNLAGALLSLGAPERAVEVLRAVDVVAASMAGEQRAYVDIVRHSYWVGASCRSGHEKTARASLDALEAAADPRISVLAMQAFRAQVAFAEGDMAEVLRVLHQIRASDEPWSATTAAGELLEVRAFVRLGQHEQALAAAARLLERLEDPISDGVPPGSLLETTRVLADEIRDLADAEDLARRAVDLAAVAAMERIWQADRFRRELPGFEFLTGDDRRVIDDFHDRFTSEYGDVLDHVARLLASEEALPRFRTPESEAATQKWIGVCAWCRRLRGPEGLWLDIGEFDPPEHVVGVTHGACEPCFDEALATVEPVA